MQLPVETEARYHMLIDAADRIYHVTLEKVKEMTNIVLLWQSFWTRGDHLLEWVDRMWNVYVNSLLGTLEYDQESVVVKLMRFSELEKRAYEKQRVRDRIEREAKALIEVTHNKLVANKLSLLNEKWRDLRDRIRNERLRLDGICRIWREFQNVHQELDQWISSCRIRIQEDNREMTAANIIKEELDVITVILFRFFCSVI